MRLKEVPKGCQWNQPSVAWEWQSIGDLVVVGHSSRNYKTARPWNICRHIQYRQLVSTDLWSSRSGAKHWRNEHRADPRKLCPASKSSFSEQHLHDMLPVGWSARIITKEAWLRCDAFWVSFSWNVSCTLDFLLFQRFDAARNLTNSNSQLSYAVGRVPTSELRTCSSLQLNLMFYHKSARAFVCSACSLIKTSLLVDPCAFLVEVFGWMIWTQGTSPLLWPVFW